MRWPWRRPASSTASWKESKGSRTSSPGAAMNWLPKARMAFILVSHVVVMSTTKVGGISKGSVTPGV